MNSGKIVERRDHVLITLLSSPNASTFFIKCSSTKGPFFKLRPIIVPPFAIELRLFLRRTVGQPRYFLRRRTIYLSVSLFFFLVLYPSVGLPHGDIGDLRPIGARPSPPPCG